MDLLSNILFASVILSLLSLIIIHYILIECDIDSKQYVRIFIYLFITSSIFMYYHKISLIKKHGYSPVNAAAEVFNEISDSQQLNGIMTFNSTTGGKEDIDELYNYDVEKCINDTLIINDISSPITCNNKL